MIRNLAVLFSSCLLLAGCGGDEPEGAADRPPTHPVSIKVVYQGEPVEGATVALIPSNADGKAASGKTNDDGVAVIQTFESGDGAVAGAYTVTVSKSPAAAASPDVSEDDPNYVDPRMAERKARKKTSPGGPKSLLPGKFASRKDSPLMMTVNATEEVQEMTFDLDKAQ